MFESNESCGKTQTTRCYLLSRAMQKCRTSLKPVGFLVLIEILLYMIDSSCFCKFAEVPSLKISTGYFLQATFSLSREPACRQAGFLLLFYGKKVSEKEEHKSTILRHVDSLNL